MTEDTAKGRPARRKIAILAELLATASRFALAAALVYFAFQLARFVDHLPQITQQVEQVSQQIPPTLEEARAIRLEVGATRNLIPEVLDEVEAARVRIPDILATADRAIDSVDAMREDVAPLLPQAIAELRSTRETIDPTLDRVDDIVEDAYGKAQDAIAAAQSAGRQASEGAVKGLFSGLVKLPFSLLGTLAAPIVRNVPKNVAGQLSDGDLELMALAGKAAGDAGELDRVHRWENPATGNSGSITLVRRYRLEGSPCVETRIAIETRRGKALDKLESYCQGADGTWTLAAAPPDPA